MIDFALLTKTLGAPNLIEYIHTLTSGEASILSKMAASEYAIDPFAEINPEMRAFAAEIAATLPRTATEDDIRKAIDDRTGVSEAMS